MAYLRSYVVILILLLINPIEFRDGWVSLSSSVAAAAQDGKQPKRKVKPKPKLHPCLKIRAFLCAQGIGQSEADCTEGIEIVNAVIRAQEDDELFKAGLLTDHCKKNLNQFDRYAKKQGFNSYEEMIKSKMTDPAHRKKLEESLTP